MLYHIYDMIYLDITLSLLLSSITGVCDLGTTHIG